jgi:hypothetical protein
MLKFVIQDRISQERNDLKASFYICWKPNKMLLRLLISRGMQHLILTLKMDREGLNWGFSTGIYKIRKMGHTRDTGSRHLPAFFRAFCVSNFFATTHRLGCVPILTDYAAVVTW